MLYDYAEREGDTPEARSARELVVVRNDRRGFNEVVDSYLRRVEFADDGGAERIHLGKYGDADVVVDPRRAFGAPVFAHGGVRLETVIAAFRAGTALHALEAEYGVSSDDLLSVLRVHTAAAWADRASAHLLHRPRPRSPRVSSRPSRCGLDGRHLVRALRRFEHYGVEDSEVVPDDEWMVEAARHGWPVLCCDSGHRKRRRPAERAALLNSGVREFVLNGNVSAGENVARVIHHFGDSVAACGEPGPFVHRVHPTHIARLNL